MNMVKLYCPRVDFVEANDAFVRTVYWNNTFSVYAAAISCKLLAKVCKCKGNKPATMDAATSIYEQVGASTGSEYNERPIRYR